MTNWLMEYGFQKQQCNNPNQPYDIIILSSERDEPKLKKSFKLKNKKWK